MPFSQNPMHEFNRNNPFIILAKQNYAEIMDRIQTLARVFILRLGLSLTGDILSIVAVAVYWFFMPFTDALIFTILSTIFIIGTTSLAIYSRWVMRYYMLEHEGIKQFDRVSNLELNEILKLNEVDIINCLYGLKELSGELRVCDKALKIASRILIFTKFFFVVYMIIIFVIKNF